VRRCKQKYYVKELDTYKKRKEKGKRWKEYVEKDSLKTGTYKCETFHIVAVTALRKFPSSVSQTLNINFIYKIYMIS
jgi:hypothetical protein